MIDHKAKSTTASAYDAFLDRYGSGEHRRRWAAVYDQSG